MRATALTSTLTLASLLAVGLCLLRADDVGKHARPKHKNAAERLEDDIRRTLDEAAKIAPTNPRESARLLQGIEDRLESNEKGVLTPARRKELIGIVAKQRRDYWQRAGIDAGVERYRRLLLKGLELSERPIEFPDSPRCRPVETQEFPSTWKELIKQRSKVGLTEKEKALVKALTSSVTMEITKRPLQTVIEQIEKTHGITIDLAENAVNPGTLVSLKVKDVPLRGALKKMLGDAGLAYIIRKDGVRVTTPQLTVDEMMIRPHRIGDLVHLGNFKEDAFATPMKAKESIEALKRIIQRIEPASWESAGGKGKITFDPQRMALVIKQSVEVHLTLYGYLP